MQINQPENDKRGRFYLQMSGKSSIFVLFLGMPNPYIALKASDVLSKQS